MRYCIFALGLILLLAGCTQTVIEDDEYLVAPEEFTEEDIRDIALNEYPGKVKHTEETDDGMWRIVITDSLNKESIVSIDGNTGVITGSTREADRRTCLSQSEAITVAMGRAGGEVVKASISKPCGIWEIHVATGTGGKIMVVRVDAKDGVVKDTRHYFR